MDEPFKFWSDESRWPRDSGQYTFLCRAVNIVGRALYPDSWTARDATVQPTAKLPKSAFLMREGDRYEVYHKLRAARPDLQLPLLVGTKYVNPKPNFTPEQWSAAISLFEDNYNKVEPHIRRFHIAKEKLFDALAIGQITSVLRSIPGGDFSPPCPISWWNTERWSLRFYWGQMDPKDPFAIGVGGDSFNWIFVERTSLQEFVDQLRGSSLTLPTRAYALSKQTGVTNFPDKPEGTPKANSVFVPKGHITLFEAMAQMGPLIIKEWTGDELNPLIWDVGNFNGFYKEREIFLANLVSESCFKAWGEQWLTAAENYISKLEKSELAVRFVALKPEIEALEMEVCDTRQAHGVITLREAARSILRHANIKTADFVPLSVNEPPPPSLQTDTGPDPIVLGQAELAALEMQTTKYFEQRDSVRMSAQERWGKLVNWFRQELFTEKLVASYIAKDGKQIKVPGHTFAQAQAEWMFRATQHENLPFLINVAALEKLLAAQIDLRSESKASDEAACKKWLELQMKASPEVKLLTKKMAKETWKTRANIGDRAFNRAWDAAIDSSGARAWSSAGAPKKPIESKH